MSNIYFVIIDTTKDREDPAMMQFNYSSYGNDLTSYIRMMADRNKTDYSAMRLFLYQTKTEWERARAHFVKQADWSRA